MTTGKKQRQSMKSQPDILFVLCDQWNARYLGCQGHAQVRTPHLDQLAATGCVFDTAYTPSPVCMPARVSLASGMYPHSHGFFYNFTGKVFPAEHVTLFHQLQQAGYTTAKIGKYHYFSLEWGEDFEDYRDYYGRLGLDWAEETSTPYQGPFLNTAYTRFLKERGLLDTYITDIAMRYVQGQYLPQPSPLPPDFTPDGYVSRRTLKYLESAPRDRPLFVCASFPGPHTPLDAPGKYAAMYDPATVELPANYESRHCSFEAETMRKMTAQYMGKMSHLDDRIGELVETLKTRGNWHNTVTVFSADHGDHMGEHNLVGKCGFEEGSARVPLIISGPGTPLSGRGRRNASPVSFLDLYPTFLELAGSRIPFQCQGASLVPILRGEKDRVHDAVFSEIADGDDFNYMLRDSRWKWSLEGTSGREHLFDMDADPHELQNLADSPAHAGTIRDLRHRFMRFLSNTQVNSARGYRILFDRIQLRFETEQPTEKQRMIIERLRDVHT